MNEVVDPGARGGGTRGASSRATVVSLLHLLWALTLAAFVVLPNLPGSVVGPSGSWLAARLRKISFVQNWRMYAPDPQRAQLYLNLTAVDDEGNETDLQETLDERNGWGGSFAWDKTRLDIWQQYVNFNAEVRSENRTWYLRSVCVREARKGKAPAKILVYQVRRSFTAPERVREGAPTLGKPRRKLLTVQYCGTSPVVEMIEADRARGEGS